jgi:hypothetical protein
MYLSEAAATCPSDLPVSDQAALLYSPAAPLASRRGAQCDHRVVWTYVPAGIRAPYSAYVYLHGNNNVVPVDARRPGGRPPSWAPTRMPPPFRPGGPFTPGLKYELDIASEASRQKPIVLVPEVSFGGSANFWSVATDGALTTDRTLLGRLIDDSLVRLTRMPTVCGAASGGRRYLAAAISLASIGRLFLGGHSGGGVPLAAAARSDFARQTPTDLWLFDCTYNSPQNASYIEFVRHWRDSGNRLGNGRGQSRMVMITVGGLTETNARKLFSDLQQPYRNGGTQRPGLTAARWTRGRLQGVRSAPGGAAPSTNFDMVEVGPEVTGNNLSTLLRTIPVVLIKTRVGHDPIPRHFSPILLDTAAPT